MDILSLNKKISIVESSNCVSKKEFQGPLHDHFDIMCDNDRFGESTFEKAESEMVRMAFDSMLKKSGLKPENIDIILGSDLQNQCVAESFGLLGYKRPYLGIYGACSGLAEEMLISSLLLQHDDIKRCAISVSSHFATSERQFRFPLEYGNQRPPTSQNTVTGAGCFILGNNNESVINISEVMPGRIIDMGVKDANNMGAAMAPAAIDTLLRYFNKSNNTPDKFDMIITGDLGYEGVAILKEKMKVYGINIDNNIYDCGMLIYDKEAQDVHSGGSGCGCSAVVMSGYIMNLLRENKVKNVLFIGTGALLSPGSVLQGQSIPGIAHLVHIEKAGV